MSLTKTQRAAISRANGAKAKGPSETARRRTRFNALKHGLRAEVLTLPNEDPHVIQARADAWNDFYQPKSPAAQHLLNQCVRATLLADRCDAFHDAGLARQVRRAELDWDYAQVDHLENAWLKVKDDPFNTLREVKRTRYGCGILKGRWLRYAGRLERVGYLDRYDTFGACLMLGLDGHNKKLRAGLPDMYRLELFHQVLCPDPDRAKIRELCSEYETPVELQGLYAADRLPEKEECRQWLRELIAREVAELEALEASLEAIETADRAEAQARALILTDGPTARLFLRYHAEARMSFHRAHTALLKQLDRDALEEELPNEPDDPVGECLSPDDPEVSDDVHGADTRRTAPPVEVTALVAVDEMTTGTVSGAIATVSGVTGAGESVV
jgi:hypothetical protein